MGNIAVSDWTRDRNIMAPLGMASGLLSILPLAGLASAAQWTITSTVVAVPTTETWTYTYDPTDIETITDTYTYTWPLSPDVTAPASAAITTSTYTDYNDLEVVLVYIDGASVDEDDYVTSYEYDYDYDEDSHTAYLMPIEMTAPSSCPTAFTYSTYTEISIPSAVISAGLVTPVSEETSYVTYERGTTYTYVTAYLSSDAVSLTSGLNDNYIYTWFVEYCTDPASYYGEYTTTSTDDGFGSLPTSTSGFGFGDDDDDNDNNDNNNDNSNGDIDEITRSRFGIEDCNDLMHCGWLTTGLICIAAILPSIFLLGFLESYFWFRRLMTGKSAFRFGTICWMFLLLPVICLTRRAPARDADAQISLKEQWRNTSFGKALGLWVKYGFRHKYPVEIIGEHPNYKNDYTASWKQEDYQKPIGYGPPPTNMAPSQPPMVYYLPTGATGQGQGAAGAGRGPTQAAPMPPPNGGAPYYPQYPQQAVYAGPPPANQQRSRQSRGRGHPRGSMTATVSSPSPVSEVAEPVTDDGPERPEVSPPLPPRMPVTPPPPVPTQGNEAGPSGQTRD